MFKENLHLKKHYLGFVVVVLVHFALVAYFVPPRVVFSNDPIYDIDYSLHYYQTDRAQKAFQGWGKLWGYDPQVLAGYPSGAIEDVSSKTIGLFTIGLSSLGVHPAKAFNIYVLIVHLLLPFVAFLSARLFNLSVLQSVAVAAFWVVLWFFDSFFHWIWFCGMISWAAATYLSVLSLALLWRAFEGQKVVLWFFTVLLISFLALHHPFVAITLFASSVALYVRGFRKLKAKSHVAIFLAMVGAVVASLVWVLPALHMSHYVLKEETFLRPTLEYLFFDFFDLTKSPVQTGPPVRTMVRFLCFAAAAYCFVRWRKEGDRRFLPLVLFVGVGALFAYGGGYLHITRITQPYRQIGPVALAAAIPATVALSNLFSICRTKGLGMAAKVLLLFAVVLLTPRFVRTVLYFFPNVISQQSSTNGKKEHKWFLALNNFTQPPI
ncbi:MAG: hypothetical protein V1754_11380, partial [Pseudomonadota bacterium]